MIGSHLADVPGCVMYAAGVSNPTCTDKAEFERDLNRLKASLELPGRFVYVSTASKADSDYVRHKREAEGFVLRRVGSVVVRIPTIAGRCSNPHTVLNWLWSRISRGEQFDLWPGAKRNIIGIRQAAQEIGRIATSRQTGIVEIAGREYPVIQVVRVMEDLAGKRAVFSHSGEPETEPDDSLRRLIGECYP